VPRLTESRTHSVAPRYGRHRCGQRAARNGRCAGSPRAARQSRRPSRRTLENAAPMADQRGLERHNCKAQSDAEEAKRDHVRHDLPAQQQCAKCKHRGRYGSRLHRRLALRREVKNDAGAVSDSEPRQQPAGCEFLRGPFTNARRRTELGASPICAPARARFGRKAKLHIPITGAQPAAVEKARHQLIVGVTRGSADQPPAAALAPTLAQVSRNPTVRLNTSRPGVESASGQK